MNTERILVGLGKVVAGSLLVLAMSLPAHAQNNVMNELRTIVTFGLMSPRLLNALNLTPDQVAKIEVSRNALWVAQKAYLAEVAVLRKDIGDKLFGPNRATDADVAAQITKLADLREKIYREGFRIALEVRSVLRPDQLAKAASIRQQLQGIQTEVRELYNEK
jgi:Spy/CpxP family protein refolding chaperone